jgi:phosphoglycerate dehydrogenase-like enzyme
MIKKPIILTPHIGGNTLESRKKTTEYVLNNFLKLEKKF